MIKKKNIFKDDKEAHKVVSYFILRKCAKILPLKAAQKVTKFLMDSKEVIDSLGFGHPEEADRKANAKGIKEASEDIINKKRYRYNQSLRELIDNLMKYLYLDRP